MIEAIHKLTEDMRGKVRLMVGRAILAAIGDDGPIQTAQARLLADETHDDMERVQEYGFTSVPLPGAEAVVVFVGGNRDHGLIVATDDRRYRKKALQPGDVAVYDHRGQYVILHQGGITIHTSETFRVEAQHIQMHATGTYRFDANGQGQKWDGQGVETWQDNDVAKPHHNHQPPEIG